MTVDVPLREPQASLQKPRLQDALRGLGVVYGGPLAVTAWWLGSLARTAAGSTTPGLVTRAGLVAPWLYYSLVRPRMLSWGAAPGEIVKSLPGDDIVVNPTKTQTRAITIKATPEEVWPWLVQIGYQRGGWYSYDALEAAAGAGDFLEGHSASRVHPELQDLEPGLLIRISPWTAYRVDSVDKPRALVLVADPVPGGLMPASSWTFVLEPIAEGTRLLVRARSAPDARNYVAWAFDHLVEAPHFIMERRMMLGIKQRAEKAPK